MKFRLEPMDLFPLNNISGKIPMDLLIKVHWGGMSKSSFSLESFIRQYTPDKVISFSDATGVGEPLVMRHSQLMEKLEIEGILKKWERIQDERENRKR